MQITGWAALTCKSVSLCSSGPPVMVLWENSRLSSSVVLDRRIWTNQEEKQTKIPLKLSPVFPPVLHIWSALGEQTFHQKPADETRRTKRGSPGFYHTKHWGRFYKETSSSRRSFILKRKLDRRQYMQYSNFSEAVCLLWGLSYRLWSEWVKEEERHRPGWRSLELVSVPEAWA